MKEIPLSGGKAFAIVDDSDYDDLMLHNWHLATNGYAFRQTVRTDIMTGARKKSVLLMHRYLLGLHFGDRMTGDHIDGNKLNNQRTNLRACSQTRNAQNVDRRVTNKSGYKGVYWSKVSQAWISRIQSERVPRHLGTFETAEEAYTAYCKAAEELHGEFANAGAVSPDMSAGRIARPRQRKTNRTGFSGVYKDKKYDLWIARIRYKGRRVNLGCFKTPEAAHAAFRTATEKVREGTLEENEINNSSRANKNGYPGVKRPPYGEKWEAYITKGGKKRYLGAFPSPEEAHLAYCAAKREYAESAGQDRETITASAG